MGVTLNDILGKQSGINSLSPFSKGPKFGSYGQSQDKYAYDSVAAPVAAATGANTQAAQTGLLDLLHDPANNSGVDAAYKSYLAAQRPAEEQGYSDLADAFREAGAMQSGNYGTALSKYASGIQNAHAIGYGNTLQSILSPMVSGYSNMATQGPNLLNSLKMQDQYNVGGMQGGGGMGVAAGRQPMTPIGTPADMNTGARY